MAYKNNRQTPFRVFLSALPEYAEKLRRFSLLILLSFIVMALFSFLFGGLYFISSNKFSFSLKSFFEMFQIGGFLLLDFMPAEHQNISSSSIAYLARLCGFVFTCLFSGVSVALFLQPINVVSFSKYAVIDVEKSQLKLRYWIKKPQDKYLNSVSISIEISTAYQRNTGLTNTVKFFRYKEPNDARRYPRGTYDEMRGVWYVIIPFKNLSVFGDLCLEEALDKFFSAGSEGDPKIRIGITGSTLNGEILARHQNYTPQDILVGYDFASIQRYEIVEKSDETESQKRDKRQLFNEHFNKVTKQEGARADAYRLRYSDSEPSQNDILKKGQWIDPLPRRIIKRVQVFKKHKDYSRNSDIDETIDVSE